MAWDSGLVGVHRDIARDTSSSLHVLAGPGTGKTYAMTRRIARLLETGTPPEKILAVTFTRTAARDMREQLHRLGIEGAERVRASTLHSFCYGMLQQKAVFAATQRVARPLLSYEQNQLVNDLASQLAGKKRVKTLLEAFEAGGQRGQQCSGPPVATNASGPHVHGASAEPTPGEREGARGVQARGAPNSRPGHAGSRWGVSWASGGSISMGGTPPSVSPKRHPGSRSWIPGSGVDCAAICGRSGVGVSTVPCAAAASVGTWPGARSSPPTGHGA
jgi:hypothetical protein